jgi:acetyltransferase-like isoleucine patch superfamily enzyme
VGKAIREIGVAKAAKFFFSTLALVLYRVMIFPPLRSTFLRILGARIGSHTVLHSCRFFNAYRRGFPGLRIGNSCFVGDECMLDLAADIVLEDHVTLAERVLILTHTNVGYSDHPLQTAFPARTAGVRVGRGSFIGSNVTILPGVEIGPNCFVAAGSVVKDSLPARSLAAGVPADVKREIEL